MAARLFGLICLAVAAGAAWLGIWEPLQAASAQEPGVRYRIGVFVLVPAAAIFGLFFLVFGNSVPYRNAERQSFTATGWMLMALVLAGSGVGFWWFKARFEALGYGYSGASPVNPAPVIDPASIPRPPGAG